jgi:hypothetical protein
MILAQVDPICRAQRQIGPTYLGRSGLAVREGDILPAPAEDGVRTSGVDSAFVM